MTNLRVLGRSEGGLLLTSGLALLGVALTAALWPRVVAIPLGVVGAWLGLSLVWRALKLRAPRSAALHGGAPGDGSPAPEAAPAARRPSP